MSENYEPSRSEDGSCVDQPTATRDISGESVDETGGAKIVSQEPANGHSVQSSGCHDRVSATSELVNEGGEPVSIPRKPVSRSDQVLNTDAELGNDPGEHVDNPGDLLRIPAALVS